MRNTLLIVRKFQVICEYLHYQIDFYIRCDRIENDRGETIYDQITQTHFSVVYESPDFPKASFRVYFYRIYSHGAAQHNRLSTERQ